MSSSPSLFSPLGRQVFGQVVDSTRDLLEHLEEKVENAHTHLLGDFASFNAAAKKKDKREAALFLEYVLGHYAEIEHLAKTADALRGGIKRIDGLDGLDEINEVMRRLLTEGQYNEYCQNSERDGGIAEAKHACTQRIYRIQEIRKEAAMSAKEIAHRAKMLADEP